MALIFLIGIRNTAKNFRFLDERLVLKCVL